MIKRTPVLKAHTIVDLSNNKNDAVLARLVDEPFEKPKCRLTGTNGNIFALLGVASKALRQAGLNAHMTEMQKRVTQEEAENYDQALGIICEYVAAY